LKGTFGEIDVFNKSVFPNSGEDERRAQAWLALQKTEGPSDLYVQRNVWQPGGNTGWHIHAGHSLIIVTEGTVTEYEGHDPDCKPHAYTKGMTFVDPGGDHIHIIRNEGAVVAQTTAIQLIAADKVRRIDVDDPGNCHF
jgi:quercetin dioxygenase-like cupin family protein